MEFVIVFFRDILDGPLYIVLVIVNSIFICSCIGYLGERYLKKEKNIEKNNSSYVSISGSIQQNNAQNINQN